MVVFVFGKLYSGNHFPNFPVFVYHYESWSTKNIFQLKKKIGMVFRKMFSFYFGQKTLSGSCKKFRNVILFADYIKFGPQTFDCYIYFVLIFFFNFIP